MLTLALLILVLTILIYQCRDIGKLWTKEWCHFSGPRCFSSAVYSYSAAIGDSVIDSMIFVLPTPYVWRLSRLAVRQRVELTLIFSLGLCVCIVALLQIPFIKRREGSVTYFGGTVNLLIAIQISLAIVAASLPDLRGRAFVARSFPKFSSVRHRSLVIAAEHCNSERARPSNKDQTSTREEMLPNPQKAIRDYVSEHC